MLLAALLTKSSADIFWTKAQKSTKGNCCVEVAPLGDLVLLRDSKFRATLNADPKAEQVIAARRSSWSWFEQSLREGRVVDAGDFQVDVEADGSATVRSASDDTELRYTPAEWSAFLDGAQRGEFGLDVLPSNRQAG